MGFEYVRVHGIKIGVVVVLSGSEKGKRCAAEVSYLVLSMHEVW